MTPPPPSRRDRESPAASDQLRDAWLAELWPTCRELSRGERFDTRQEQRKLQREMEDRRISAGLPPVSPDLSPGCAETGPGNGRHGDAKCA